MKKRFPALRTPDLILDTVLAGALIYFSKRVLYSLACYWFSERLDPYSVHNMACGFLHYTVLFFSLYLGTAVLLLIRGKFDLRTSALQALICLLPTLLIDGSMLKPGEICDPIFSDPRTFFGAIFLYLPLLILTSGFYIFFAALVLSPFCLALLKQYSDFYLIKFSFPLRA